MLYTCREMIPGTHWTGVWVCPSVTLDAFQKILHPLLGIKPWFWGLSAQTLATTPYELLHLPPNGVLYTMTVMDLVSSVTKCIYCVDLAVFVYGVLYFVVFLSKTKVKLEANLKKNGWTWFFSFYFIAWWSCLPHL